MIGQQIGLEYLVPLALEQLARQPWLDSEYYEGDLLCVLLRVPLSFWQLHPEWARQLQAVVQAALAGAPQPPEDAECDEDVLRRLEAWNQSRQAG